MGFFLGYRTSFLEERYQNLYRPVKQIRHRIYEYQYLGCLTISYYKKISSLGQPTLKFNHFFNFSLKYFFIPGV